MTTMFARFHPNLIVGGTYCGQIVLWDNRSNKQTPVQRTPLSAKAHTVTGFRKLLEILLFYRGVKKEFETLYLSAGSLR